MIFDNIEFEFIISLGHNCTIANSLIDISARGGSYPFDWNLTNIEFVDKCFQTKFIDFFKKELYVQSGKGHNNAPKYKNYITFVHDGSYENIMLSESGFNYFKDKYSRRINRLYENLHTETNILFVVDEYYCTVQNIKNFKKTIESCDFEANIKLLVLTSKKELLELNSTDNNFVFVSQLNLSRWSIGSFINKNINFKKYPKLRKNRSTYHH